MAGKRRRVKLEQPQDAAIPAAAEEARCEAEEEAREARTAVSH